MYCVPALHAVPPSLSVISTARPLLAGCHVFISIHRFAEVGCYDKGVDIGLQARRPDHLRGKVDNHDGL